MRFLFSNSVSRALCFLLDSLSLSENVKNARETIFAVFSLKICILNVWRTFCQLFRLSLQTISPVFVLFLVKIPSLSLTQIATQEHS